MRRVLVRNVWRAGILGLALTLAPALPGAGQPQGPETPQPGEVPQPAYALGPGDVIQVAVLAHPELTQTAQVGPDGRASLFFVGSVYVAGMTVEQVGQMLTKAYADYVVSPQVAVAVSRYRTIHVSVLGQVNHPGIYELPLTARVEDALSAAAGLTQTAALSRVQLQRVGEAPMQVDLAQALQGNAGQNPPLQSGDTVVVPEDTTLRFYVFGDVNHPGQFPLTGPTTLLQALVTAGGPTARGIGGAGTVYLVRHVDGSGAGGLPIDLKDLNPQQLRDNTVIVKIDLRALEERGNLMTQPGDVLYVPASALSAITASLGVLLGIAAILVR